MCDALRLYTIKPRGPIEVSLHDVKPSHRSQTQCVRHAQTHSAARERDVSGAIFEHLGISHEALRNRHALVDEHRATRAMARCMLGLKPACSKSAIVYAFDELPPAGSRGAEAKQGCSSRSVTASERFVLVHCAHALEQGSGQGSTLRCERVSYELHSMWRKTIDFTRLQGTHWL